jgi:putative oxidoreductase
MTPLRLIARPMLASMFVTGGLDAVMNPEGKAKAADPIAGPIASRIPWLPQDPVTLVRLNGAVMLSGGSLLALGRVPRLAALAIAGTLVPTTFAGHRFWEIEDRDQRTMQRIQFFKNLSMLGGLLIAALDTGGRPSIGWRVQHAKGHATAAARRNARDVRRERKTLARGVRARIPLT